jgi:SAM-dependent methyltransferase
MQKQVSKQHYAFLKYNDEERWASYYHQLQEILSFEPESIVEIGVGSNILRPILEREGISYTSVDVAEDLVPDIQASVEALPLGDKTADVVCAFEVLEHLPFSKFETALSELLRVARKGVILSLPHYGPPLKLSFKLPFLREKRIAIKLHHPVKHVFNGQHFWEIGKRGYAPREVRRVIEKQAKVVREYVPHDNQYHHFYVLTAKEA